MMHGTASRMKNLLWISTVLAMITWLWRPIRHANDIWWHLATGRFIVQHGLIPKTDVFSWTANGHPWVNHEWLYELVLYAFYRIAGLNGAIVLKILLILGALALAWTRMKEDKVPGGIRWVWTIVLFWASRYGWNDRADLVSLFFLSLLMTLMPRPSDSGQSRRRLVWIPFVLVTWANAHAGFMLGLVILFLYGLGHGLQNKIPRLYLICYSALCVAATMLNPWGFRLHQSTLDGFRYFKLSVWTEWQRTPWHPLQGFWCALIVFWLLLIFHARRTRAIPWTETLVGILLSSVAIRYVRNVPYFMIGAFPYAARWLAGLPYTVWFYRECRRWAVPAVGAALIAVWSFIARAAPAMQGGFDKRLFPVEACEFISRSRLPGTFFNDYEPGSYWIWHFAEKRPVFMDGRFHSIEGYPELYLNSRAAQADTPEHWNRYLDTLGIDAALVSYPDRVPLPAVFQLYFPRQRWALIYWDDAALIFVRRTKVFQPFIKRFEFPAIDPEGTAEHFQEQRRSSQALARQLKRDVERNRRLHPDSSRTENFYMLLRT